MAMTANEIQALIQEGIPNAIIEITDLRGDGEHYAVVVTAPEFAGMSRIQQHRMVQDSFKGQLGTTLHALQIHTKLP